MSYEESIGRLREIKNAPLKAPTKPSKPSSVGSVGSHRRASAKNTADDWPLAAKLRAIGCPIALEVEGRVLAWIVADEAAALRADLAGPVFTAEEAAVLAQFDAASMRRLIDLKALLGGRLQSDKGTP